VAIPVQEFIGLGGFGGGVKAAELEFLNLLHIEYQLFRYTYRNEWQKIQKKLQKNLPPHFCEGNNLKSRELVYYETSSFRRTSNLKLDKPQLSRFAKTM